MFSVCLLGISKAEPVIEFTEYTTAVRYAESLLARQCNQCPTARAQVTDAAGGIHWTLSCSEWRTLTSPGFGRNREREI